MNDFLHFDVHDGNGPPVLLLHGFMSSRAQWLANIPGLQRFCTPVTVELWGHGRSPMPSNPAMLSPVGYIEQFERIRDQLAVSSWYVLGQSFGAGLTLRYTLDCPDAVWGQAFCNSNSALEDYASPPQNRRGQQLQVALREGKPLRELPMHPVNGKRLPADVKAALIEDADNLDPQSLLTSVNATRPQLSVLDRFAETCAPTLLLNGKYERSFQKTVETALSLLPALEVAELDGGHAVNAEVAEAFNRALRVHFEKHQHNRRSCGHTISG